MGSNIPLAPSAFLMSRQARMTRAPLLARSMAVSLPMPVLAPVMMTVLPVILFLLVQIAFFNLKQTLTQTNIDNTNNATRTSKGNDHKYINIFVETAGRSDWLS